MMSNDNSLNDQLNKLDHNIKKVNKMEIQSGTGLLVSENRRLKHAPMKSVKFHIEDD
jgi:hypothetical protein